MTLEEAIDHVWQNIAEKLSGDTVITQTAFLSDVVNLYIVPHVVSLHDWSWKYDYVDQALLLGDWKFTPDLTSLGATILLDDLYEIVLRTGEKSTSKTIKGRDLKWFLEHYPVPDLNEKGRPDWFTTIGSPGDSRHEVWFSQPLEAAYTVRLILLKTYAAVALGDQLPFRVDKHMLLVSGATSYAFASLEQFDSAKPWLDLFLSATELWWLQDQSKGHVETRLGRYQPGGKRVDPGDYWKVAQITGVVGS